MWRSKLFEWMATCHGAVLLLSAKALTSEWVRTEGTILAWRSALDPRVKVVPVLLGPTPDDVRNAGFGPVALDERQMVEEAPDHPDEVASRVAGAFASHQPLSGANDPIALWVKRIGHLLKNNGFLDQAAEVLNISAIDRPAEPQYLSSLIAHALLHAQLPAIEGAVQFLGAEMNDADRSSLGCLVSPSVLPETTAGGLLRVGDGQSGCRVALLSAHCSRTGLRLIRRATCWYPFVEVVPEPPLDGTGESEGEDLVQRYRKEIGRLYGVGADLSSLDATVVDGYNKTGKRMFVLLEETALSQGVLESLHAEFHNVVFVCAARTAVLEAVARDVIPGFASEVEPALDQESERQSWVVANRLERVS
jgi:hypothetical protein